MTREEIAVIVRDALRQAYGGYFEDWVEKGIVVANAFLARLGPMAEEGFYGRAAARLIAERDTLRANLCACAEALRHACESEDPSEWDSEALAALALPGVKELLT